MLLAIDAGADCGWALFKKHELWRCGFRQMPCEGRKEITRILIERPHPFGGKARKRDIITLAIRAGELGGIWAWLTRVEPEYIEPHRWKGSVAKEEMNQRIRAKLTSREVERFELDCKKVGKSFRHNVLDAIGIGLWANGRL